MKPTSPPSPHDPRKAPARHAAHDELHNDDTAHEESDINIGAVLTATGVIAVVCVVTAGLMLGLFRFLESQAEARDPRLSPLAMPATQMPPTTIGSPAFGSAPDPKLLTNEPRYLSGVRAEWQKDLHTYGWVDQQAGIARIPIERAKHLLLTDKPLAVRAEPVEDRRVGTHAPAYGEASSGRTITRPDAAAPGEAPAHAPAEQKTEPPKNPADHRGATGHK
jgi:hypothetical protein